MLNEIILNYLHRQECLCSKYQCPQIYHRYVKVVKVPDVFVFRFVDDKIASVRVESPAKGGVLGMLQQLGVLPA